METPHAAFIGSIPENYDRYLGPALFEPYANDLVKRVTVPESAIVLEIACGTGIVTRRLRDQVPSNVKIIATDLNEAMIDYAKQKFRPAENIEWKQADATDLSFAGKSFDAVICQFGLMFMPDKNKAAAEALRVLKPGGTFLFSVWDSLERNDLAYSAHTTIAKYFDNDPPDFYEVPFSFHDPEPIRSLMAKAGFADIEITPVGLASVAASARCVAHGLVHGNPIINALSERCESRIPEIETDVAAVVAEKYGDRPVHARMNAFVCSGVRPG